MVFQREVWKEEVELRVKEALGVARARSDGQPVPFRGLQEVQVCAAAGRNRKGRRVRHDGKMSDIAKGCESCMAYLMSVEDTTL